VSICRCCQLNLRYYITCYENLYCYQNILQTPLPNTKYTKRIHTAHVVLFTTRPWSSKIPQKFATASPQLPHSTLSRALFKRQAAALSLSMFKIIATALLSRRWHSARTERTQRCWRLRNILRHCENAV